MPREGTAINEEDFIFFNDPAPGGPDRIAWSHPEREFGSLEGMISSGDDGFLNARPGRSPADPAGPVAANIPSDLPGTQWLRRRNDYPGLRLLQVHNALVIPPAALEKDNRRYHLCEVHDANGALVLESMTRPGEISLNPEKVALLRRESEPLPGAWLYGGRFWNHYGHFIIETLSTLWPYASLSLDPSAVRPLYMANSPKVPSGFVTHAFEKNGITAEQVKISARPRIVEKLIIPTPSARIHLMKGDYIHPVQKETWNTVSDTSPTAPSRKIYLSRRMFLSKEEGKRPLENEEQVEKLFSAQGFEVIFPEQIPFDEQLKMYSEAAVIAGQLGSNLLNAAFAADGVKLVGIGPRSFRHPTLMMLADVKHLESFIFLSLDDHIRFDSRDSWKVDIDELAAFLRENGIFDRKRGLFGRLIRRPG
jgi:capsular polysaccharide biosynthesis protein